MKYRIGNDRITWRLIPCALGLCVLSLTASLQGATPENGKEQAPEADPSTRLAAAADSVGIPPEIRSESYLFEIVMHLYRWYLDESDIDGLSPDSTISIWAKRLNPKLDEGDASEFIELRIPALHVIVQLKKTDYRIEELDVEVKSDWFKIVDVAKDHHKMNIQGGSVELTVGVRPLLEYVFNARSKRVLITPEIEARLKAVFRRKVVEEQIAFSPDRPEIFFASGLSPVSNELWLFWETQRKLVRFSSDVDLITPAVWEHESLLVDFFDLDTQVVVSLMETPGSNAYLTRDQVGRVLYNCIVIGHRFVVQPPQEIP